MTTDALLYSSASYHESHIILLIRRSVRLLRAAARVRRMPTTCHHASFYKPCTNQRGLRSVGSLRLASIPSRPVATSGNRWQQVATGGNKWQQVATSGNRSHPVTSSGDKWQQVSPGGSAIAFRFAPRAPN
jgi:hypothetical protein